MDTTPLNVTLSSGQRAKLLTAFKQKNGSTIQLTHEQLTRRTGGKDIISVTRQQANDIAKARNQKKGYRLRLSSNQLKENYRGGFLPLVFAGLAALGSLIGGASAVANSVIDYKDRRSKLEEVIRHNKVMENKRGGRVMKPRSQTTKRTANKNGGGVKRPQSAIKQTKKKVPRVK